VTETIEPVRSSLATNTCELSAWAAIQIDKARRIPFRDSIGLRCLRILLPWLAGRRIDGSAVRAIFYPPQIYQVWRRASVSED
jgi:hypothetical protein